MMETPPSPLVVPRAPQALPWIIRARVLDRGFVLAMLWALWRVHIALRNVRHQAHVDHWFPLPLTGELWLIIGLLFSGMLALVVQRFLYAWIGLLVAFQGQLAWGMRTMLIQESHPDVVLVELYSRRWDDWLWWLYLGLTMVQAMWWAAVRRRREQWAVVQVAPLADVQREDTSDGF